MAGIVRLYPGRDFARLANLYKGSVVFDMTGAVCKARVVSANSDEALSDQVSLSAGASGADWANSKIALIISSAATASITAEGAARIEIMVTQAGVDDHWLIPIDIVKSHVS